ncbi:MAG: hypothetical protein U1F10_16205 [Burkholderiales bacterium]
MSRRSIYHHGQVPKTTDDVRFSTPELLQSRNRTYAERALAWANPPTPEPTGGFESLRRSQPCAVLLPATRRWLQSLPKDVQPTALVRDFARIANALATAWGNRHDVEVVLGNLIVDRRGGRKGFPKPVEEELMHLWHYWQWSADAPHGGISVKRGHR